MALAGVYAVLWPSSAATPDSTSLSYLFLRWGHSAPWVLLALSFFVRGSVLPGNKSIANILGITALLIYMLFLLVASLSASS